MLHVARHESDRYRWDMVTRAAPRALRGYVRNYTGYEEWSAAPLCRREVPSGDVTLILDATLTARAAHARRPSHELAWAWGRMRSTSGRAAIGDLAEELGWSHRRLIARFREQIGLPPKTLGRVLRFERVSRLLRETTAPRFAEVAVDCGYYDQAHLNRDFREFADTTPGAYLASRLPDGGGVKSVQDG